MIDKFYLSIPFKNESVVIPKDCEERESGFIDLEDFDLSELASRLSKDVNGNYTVDDLNHPFESLPSSFTPMAMKVYKGSNNSWPRVVIKASPAKLSQGHNVFGSDDPIHGMELLYLLGAAYPQLCECLDFRHTEIVEIDCTYSACLPTVNSGLPVISYLKNVGNHQLKFSEGYDSTVYWNKASEHGSLKAYLKFLELQDQLKEFKRKNKSGCYDHIIAIMTDEKLLKFAEKLIRFEATITKRKLHDLGVPVYFFDFIKHFEKLKKEGRNLIQELFLAKATPLFESLRGGEVNIYDDEEVLNGLKAKHARVNKKGVVNYDFAKSVFRTFRSIASDGYEETRDPSITHVRTFSKHVKAMIEAGISKASLQNMKHNKSSSNIVPILKLIEIDFSNQFPGWYQEPKSQFFGDVIPIFKSSNSGQNLRLAS